MKKNNTSVCSIPELTIGVDLSDRSFRFCEMNQQGEIVAEGPSDFESEFTMRAGTP